MGDAGCHLACHAEPVGSVSGLDPRSRYGCVLFIPETERDRGHLGRWFERVPVSPDLRWEPGPGHQVSIDEQWNRQRYAECFEDGSVWSLDGIDYSDRVRNWEGLLVDSYPARQQGLALNGEVRRAIRCADVGCDSEIGMIWLRLGKQDPGLYIEQLQ